MTKIRFEYVTCQLDPMDVIEPKSAMDNIHMISMEVKVKVGYSQSVFSFQIDHSLEPEPETAKKIVPEQLLVW